MPADSKTLIEKIEALPAERIAEIEDFVDFIRLREQERALTRAAAAASAPAIPKTTSTMPFDFGDVVLVPFPFTSQRASKKRPAVVVSNRLQHHPAGSYCNGGHQPAAAEPRLGRDMDQPLASGRVAQALSGQTGVRDP
jgi:hypothetical protein